LKTALKAFTGLRAVAGETVYFIDDDVEVRDNIFDVINEKAKLYKNHVVIATRI